MSLKRIFRVYELRQENNFSIYYQPYTLVEPATNLDGRYPSKEVAEKEILEYGYDDRMYIVLETMEILKND